MHAASASPTWALAKAQQAKSRCNCWETLLPNVCLSQRLQQQKKHSCTQMVLQRVTLSATVVTALTELCTPSTAALMLSSARLWQCTMQQPRIAATAAAAVCCDQASAPQQTAYKVMSPSQAMVECRQSSKHTSNRCNMHQPRAPASMQLRAQPFNTSYYNIVRGTTLYMPQATGIAAALCEIAAPPCMSSNGCVQVLHQPSDSSKHRGY